MTRHPNSLVVGQYRLPLNSAAVTLRSLIRRALVVAIATGIAACGGDDDAAAPAPMAVLSAFPGEMAAVLEHATVTSSVTIGDRTFRMGSLAGVPVVIGMTGVGLVNAGMITRTVIDRFHVRGVVVSAVAGSTLQIGDVIVPTTWKLFNGGSFDVNRRWLDVATTIASSGRIELDRCTVTAATRQSVCMIEQPIVVIGGVGQSRDPFGDTPVGCIPNGDYLYGCDVPAGTPGSAATAGESVSAAAATDDSPMVSDMETAAIAREASASGLPFIAFRALSDGSGDPLGLPGFPAQFGEYYAFAARNAAAATVAFLKEVR